MEHVVKRYCVQGTAVEGNIEEERGRGRKRMGMLGDRKDGRRYRQLKVREAANGAR